MWRFITATKEWNAHRVSYLMLEPYQSLRPSGHDGSCSSTPQITVLDQCMTDLYDGGGVAQADTLCARGLQLTVTLLLSRVDIVHLEG